MDRRTILAFVLVALIMAANLFFMERMAPPRSATPGVTDSLRAAPPDESVARSAPPQETALDLGPFPAAGDGEPEIEVRTPLYRARISMAGGLITGLELPEFEDASGGPVNLVAASLAGPGRAALGLSIRTGEIERDLGQARFEPVGELPASGLIEIEAGSEPRRLTLRCAGSDGSAVLKHFVIDPRSYAVRLEVEIVRGQALAQVDSYTLRWTSGLSTTEVNQGDDWTSFQVSAQVNGAVHRENAGGGFSLFGRGRQEGRAATLAGDVGWLAMKSKYFTVALIPESQENGTVRLLSDPQTRWMGLEITHPLPWRSRPREAYRIYAGPISYPLLEEQGVGLEANVELGWRWVRPFSRLILACMNFLYGVIPNYGVIILILSALTKLVFWPLSEKSFRSMKEMQNLQPVMQELRRRYRDDPKEMNRQTMALYKHRGVNPLGGCMPLLVQMPIFFALYSVLRSSIDLRSAPFVLWIDDLAAPDVLFRLPFSLPFLGRSFSLLPLLMGAAMIWQSRMGSTMPATGPAAQQQLIMKWVTPILFTVIFYKMPSGLVLYWLVNTVLSVWQQLMINRKYAGVAAAGAVAEFDARGGSHAAADRSDGRQRRGGAGKGADRARRTAR